MPGELGVHVRAEGRVNGRQHLGQLLQLDDVQPSDGERVGHFQADVPGADDQGGLGRGFLQGAHESERVAHRVQQVHAVARARAGSGR